MSKRPPNTELAKNIYGQYCIPASSSFRIAARTILAGDIYEPQTIKFMAEQCGEGDIVHAGTYFGDFLPALSKAVSATAKIWAFEPNKENFNCAEFTLEMNTIKNVALKNAGLGERAEKLTIMTVDELGRGLGGKVDWTFMTKTKDLAERSWLILSPLTNEFLKIETFQLFNWTWRAMKLRP